MPHDVFVSYSEKDKPVADAVVARLEQARIRCWAAPRDIAPGASWGGAIVDAISASRAMVLVLSANSNASSQVVREVERAVASGVIIIPLRIEAVTPTGAMAYFLGTQHWLDAITPPLEQHIDRLRIALGAVLGTEPLAGQPDLPPPPPAAVAPATGGVGAAGIPTPAEPRQGRRRVAMLLAAGAVVVVGAGVGIGVLVGGGEDEVASATTSAVPEGTTATPTTTVAVTLTSTSTTPPTTTSAGPAAAWMRVGHDEAVFGGPGDQVMMRAAPGGPGLVAVGYETSAGDDDAAVWTSADGLAWSRVPHDEAIFGGSGSQFLTSLAAGGPGLAAVGADTSGGDHDAAVWTSVDGSSWSRVPHDEAVFGGPDYQVMEAVSAAGPGLIAVGNDGSGGDWDAAVWTSADGLIWSRVPHDEAVFGGGDHQAMFGVAAGNQGVVAVGSSGGDAAVWTSADGFVWSRVAHDEAVFGGVGQLVMRGVAAGGPGLVGVGYDTSGGDWDAAVWISVDGFVWSRVAHDEAVFGGRDNQGMFGVVAGNQGVVAVGYDGLDAAVWSSVDGLSWSRASRDEGTLGSSEGMFMSGVTRAVPGLVAVGYDAAGGDLDAALWLAAAEPIP